LGRNGPECYTNIGNNLITS